MSRSPHGRRRFNDYRPLPPPSPQSRSERMNAVNFADELYLQADATTPNGSVPHVTLLNLSPRRGSVSPRHQSASRGRAEFTSGVRLHSRAGSTDRMAQQSVPRRRLYHDATESRLSSVPYDARDYRGAPSDPPRGLFPNAAQSATHRHASAPRTSTTYAATGRLAATPDVAPSRGYSASPPVRTRSHSRPQPRRAQKAPAVAGPPAVREVRRPPGYHSYARHTFNSRQQKTEKRVSQDDIFTRVLQRPPWNPNTTPTHTRHPLQWSAGVEDTDNDEALLEANNHACGARGQRSVSSHRVEADGRDVTRGDWADARPSLSAAGHARAAPAAADVSDDIEDALSATSPPLVGADAGGVWQERSPPRNQARGARRGDWLPDEHAITPASRSPFHSHEAQLLEEILTEVERLRVEAKEQRRQLREYRRREKSYQLHIQALERVLLQARACDHGAAAQKSVAADPPRAHPPAVATNRSGDTTLQSLGLSPVPHTSVHPLPSTSASPTQVDNPVDASRRSARGDAQQEPQHPAPPAVDSLLEKLKDLQAIERRLRDELRDAVARDAHSSDAGQFALGLEAQMNREAPALDEVALYHEREERMRQQQYQRRTDEYRRRAELLAQYRSHSHHAPVLDQATAVLTPSLNPSQLVYAQADTAGRHPRPRTASGDYAVRIHHSHHLRADHDPEKDYTLGVQGDPVCMASTSESAFPSQTVAHRADDGVEGEAGGRWTERADDHRGGGGRDADGEVAHTTPPPPLHTTVAAQRDAATYGSDAEDAARAERARERALLLESLEVSPTKRNAHLHEVRKNIVARPRPHVDPSPPVRDHIVVEGTNEAAVNSDSDLEPLSVMSDHDRWRFQREQEGLE